MDCIVEYLIKSGIALSVFYLFYWLVMRKSTHFGINRLTLATSLVASLVLPFIRFDLSPEVVAASLPVMRIDLANVVRIVSKPEPAWGIREIVLFIYFAGFVITLFRLIYQSIYIHVISKMSRTITKGKYTIVLVEKEITPFAYFSKIFIPESKMDESSFESILAHEKSHLRQYHFLDLFLIEIVTIVQWFNPVVWLYERSLKEVHEYMADDDVLKQGVSKGNYQALLVNQALGGPAFTISHQFNQSLILKRIVMMTKMKSPQLAKTKALLFIPLAVILLMAFSNPEPIVYPLVSKVESLKQQISESNMLPGYAPAQNKGTIKLKGKVVDEATSKPLEGVNIIVKGTTTGTTTDAKGNFEVSAKTTKMELVFSYIGYASVAKEFTTSGNTAIHMAKSAMVINEVEYSYAAKGRNAEITPEPYVIIDGVPSDNKTLSLMDQTEIERVNVLKDKDALAAYGEKGREGVILVTTKKENARGAQPALNKTANETKADKKSTNKEVFMVVEEMPSFPGGETELNKFLASNLRVPVDGIKAGLTGKVLATFIVKENGSIAEAKVLRGLGKDYDEEVLRVINLMPKWIPGTQNGKPAAVQLTIPVKFAK